MKRRYFAFSYEAFKSGAVHRGFHFVISPDGRFPIESEIRQYNSERLGVNPQHVSYFSIFEFQNQEDFENFSGLKG